MVVFNEGLIFYRTFCDSVMAETKSILGNEVVFRLRNEISDIECEFYVTNIQVVLQ